MAWIEQFSDSSRDPRIAGQPRTERRLSSWAAAHFSAKVSRCCSVSSSRPALRSAQTSGRLKKIELLATCLRQMSVDERAIGARYLAGELPHKTGIGYATVARGDAAERSRRSRRGSRSARSTGDSPRSRSCAALARRARARTSSARCSRSRRAPEQKFLGGLAVGEVRQGALDGLVVEAIAKAAELPADCGAPRVHARRRPRRGRRGGARRRCGRDRSVRADAVPPGPADARADRRRPGDGARELRRARPRSSSSSTAFASRSTRTATSCARTRARSTTSPTTCPRSSRRSRRCRRAS